MKYNFFNTLPAIHFASLFIFRLNFNNICKSSHFQIATFIIKDFANKNFNYKKNIKIIIFSILKSKTRIDSYLKKI